MSLKKLPQNGKIAVLGAGISGLTFTYFLSKLRPDIKFDIYEKSSKVGGWMSSPSLHVKDSGELIILEKGPRTLRGIRDGSLLMIDILRKLGLEDQIEVIHKSSIANKKYITDSTGELIQVPNSLKTFIEFMKNVKAVDSKLFFGILKEPFVKPLEQDESVEQFFKRRLGSTSLTDNVASAIIHGVYAGDISKLSIKSTMPFMKDLENESGSIIKHMLKSIKKKKPISLKHVLSDELETYETKISPESNLSSIQSKLKDYPMIKLHDGLQTLPTALASYLSQNKNIKFHFNSPIIECDPKIGLVNDEEYDHIRSTIDSYSLANSLPLNNPLIPDLKSVQYISIFLTNIYSKKSILIPHNKPGFGFLRPRHQQIKDNPQALLGVIYDSDIEKNVVKLFDSTQSNPAQYEEYNKITVMMGGHYYNNWNIPSNNVNLQIVKEILQDKLKVNISKFNIKIVDYDPTNEDFKIDSIGDNDIIISYNLIENCIPQYNLGYQEIKANVFNIVDKENFKLSFGGTVFGDGIGVPDCVSNALKDATKLS
ncbi:HEM14 [Candida pseudojiufengensis]|uniref:HEM14 n=1 Tax=Candida pseudojiufengensis TaxID=497109 RepID=UPI0022245446|nr:HEM14 [Candida pseudojiufengensis]KAI5963644.1 HEM14 [Candida pseudojiufengensis]